MKAFVLVRGKGTEMLFLYDRVTWSWVKRSKQREYTFVVDHDDPKVLKQMQKLVNKDIEIKD